MGSGSGHQPRVIERPDPKSPAERSTSTRRPTERRRETGARPSAEFARNYNAYTGENIGEPHTASTAAIGTAIMTYRAQTGDTRYDFMLEGISRWLIDVQENNGGSAVPEHPLSERERAAGINLSFAEPNAVAYAFLDQYGRNYHDRRSVRAADQNPAVGEDFIERHDDRSCQKPGGRRRRHR